MPLSDSDGGSRKNVKLMKTIATTTSTVRKRSRETTGKYTHEEEKQEVKDMDRQRNKKLNLIQIDKIEQTRRGREGR